MRTICTVDSLSFPPSLLLQTFLPPQIMSFFLSHLFPASNIAFIYQMIAALSITFENTVFSLIPKENTTVSIGSVLK
jgi:hypothetical protein